MESTDFSSILNTVQKRRKINRKTNGAGLAVPSFSAAKWFTGRISYPITVLEVQFQCKTTNHSKYLGPKCLICQETICVFATAHVLVTPEKVHTTLPVFPLQPSCNMTNKGCSFLYHQQCRFQKKLHIGTRNVVWILEGPLAITMRRERGIT